MIISKILKSSFTSILITLLITLQMSACGLEEAANNNSPAIISGTDSGSVTEDVDPDGDNLLEVDGKLDITDADAGEAAFKVATISGNYGTLTINEAGNWNYAANNNADVIQGLVTGASLTDNLTVRSIDSTSRNVVITIAGADEARNTNSPAVISGNDRGSVTEDVDPDGDNLLEVSGKLNITDADAGEAAFIAATISGNYGTLSINAAGNWNYAANNNAGVIQNLVTGASLTDNFTVRSIDSTSRSVVITIAGVDEASTTINISLTWVAPSERENNQPISLSEIAGYKIYYGTTRGKYSNTVVINNGTIEDYTFTDLSSGTYYFVVTTYDTAGRESKYSTEVEKVLL